MTLLVRYQPLREKDLLELFHPKAVDKVHLRWQFISSLVICAYLKEKSLTSVPGLTRGEAYWAKFFWWHSAYTVCIYLLKRCPRCSFAVFNEGWLDVSLWQIVSFGYYSGVSRLSTTIGSGTEIYSSSLYFLSFAWPMTSLLGPDYVFLAAKLLRLLNWRFVNQTFLLKKKKQKI